MHSDSDQDILFDMNTPGTDTAATPPGKGPGSEDRPLDQAETASSSELRSVSTSYSITDSDLSHSTTSAPPKKVRHKRGRNVSKFLETTAGSSGSDSEGELNELAKEDNLDYIHNYKSKDEFMENIQNNQNLEDVAKSIENKYLETKRKEAEVTKTKGEYKGLMNALVQQSIYKQAPSAGTPNQHTASQCSEDMLQYTQAAGFTSSLLFRKTDPNIYAVKCRKNCEQSLVLQVTNKCLCYLRGVNHERKKVDLGVISCFAFCTVKGYFYVESYRLLFVENAVSGLENVFRHRIVQIEPSELVGIVRHHAGTRAQVGAGAFARVRGHRQYGGDLCRVVGPGHGRRIAVRVALCDQGKNGHEVIEVSRRHLQCGPEMAQPTLGEIRRFLGPAQGHGTASLHREMASERYAFRPNDPVAIHRGAYQGLCGTVRQVDSIDPILHIEVGGLVMAVETSHCRPHFVEGAKVEYTKNMAGDYLSPSALRAHKDTAMTYTGTVIKSLADSVVVLSDSCKEEVIPTSLVQVKSTQPTQRKSYQGLKLFDLVKVRYTEPNTQASDITGIITSLNPQQASILTEHNQTVSYQLTFIEKVSADKHSAKDPFGNTIVRKEAVEVLQDGTEHRRKHIGEVLQVHRDRLFLRIAESNRPTILQCLPCYQVRVLSGHNKLTHSSPTKLDDCKYSQLDYTHRNLNELRYYMAKPYDRGNTKSAHNVVDIQPSTTHPGNSVPLYSTVPLQ